MATTYTISSKGSCIPKNSKVLFVFQSVQKEANRFLDAQSKPLLICDGKLGSKTLAAINSVKNTFPTSGALGVHVSSCTKVADNPATYYNSLNSIANQNRLAIVECPPRSIIQKITEPEPRVQPDGTVIYPGVATAGLGGVPYWLIALIGGGSYYYFYKTKGGKKTLKSLTGGF